MNPCDRENLDDFLAWHRRLCRRIVWGFVAGLVIGGVIAWRVWP